MRLIRHRIATSSQRPARVSTFRTGLALGGFVIAVASAVLPIAALADPVQQTNFSFTIGADGGRPRSGLILDKQGALYGTTSAGGNTAACFSVPGCGVVFKMTPPQAGQTLATETVLYTFGGGADGSAPYAGLVMDASGALYGAVSQGGENGYGNVFKLAPPAAGQGAWTKTTLFSFSAGDDGGTPLGTLALDKAGALYGTTQAGGAYGHGVVFRLAPPKSGETAWRETVLHAFRGEADGGAPVVGVTLDEAGALYGSTPAFGKYGFGVAFSLARPPKGSTKWTKAILHTFTNGADGSYPQSAFLLDKTGALIGATSNMGAGATGVGTVFKLRRPSGGSRKWTRQTLFDFNGFLSTGANPVGNLVMDSAGTIYGTTVAGGVSQFGVVYKLTQPASGTGPWIESEPAQFFGGGVTGAQPLGGVAVDAAGRLFGTTLIGGQYSMGRCFRWRNSTAFT